MDKLQPLICRRTWRKLVKKLQRSKRRQRAAKDRDKLLEEVKLDPAYQQRQQQQNELAAVRAAVGAQQQQEEEEAWLRRELIAQQQFRLDRRRREQEEAERENLRLQQQKLREDQEAAQRQQQEERKRRLAETALEFERTIERMTEYVDDTGMATPPELRRYVETRPEAKSCELYERTNCCRYGDACKFNHRRPLLSRIVLMRNFFVHPVLEQYDEAHVEYAGADASLELSDIDLKEDYDAFFEDVIPELERFGEIRNFRVACNSVPHLRGNVFVEYIGERSALKAFSNLQGRYYATKRLNVEFANIKSWRSAICGISMRGRCPKQHKCMYLHVFQNPLNKINVREENTEVRTVERKPQSSTWDDEEEMKTGRNWRWSESPELEIVNMSSDKSHTNDAQNKKSINPFSGKHKVYHQRSSSWKKDLEQRNTERFDSRGSQDGSNERQSNNKYHSITSMDNKRSEKRSIYKQKQSQNKEYRSSSNSSTASSIVTIRKQSESIEECKTSQSSNIGESMKQCSESKESKIDTKRSKNHSPHIEKNIRQRSKSKETRRSMSNSQSKETRRSRSNSQSKETRRSRSNSQCKETRSSQSRNIDDKTIEQHSMNIERHSSQGSNKSVRRNFESKEHRSSTSPRKSSNRQRSRTPKKSNSKRRKRSRS